MLLTTFIYGVSRSKSAYIHYIYLPFRFRDVQCKCTPSSGNFRRQGWLGLTSGRSPDIGERMADGVSCEFARVRGPLSPDCPAFRVLHSGPTPPGRYSGRPTFPTGRATPWGSLSRRTRNIRAFIEVSPLHGSSHALCLSLLAGQGNRRVGYPVRASGT